MTARIAQGEVTITLNGEERVLRPSIRAIQTLSSGFSGMAELRAALVREDFNAAVATIRWGLNLSEREAKELPEQVYKNGLDAELLVPLIKFVGNLSRGGKPLPEDLDEAAGAPAGDGAPAGN